MRLVAAFAAAACIVAPVRVTGAEPPAVLTLVEGQASLLRGTTRYALGEGVRLHGGDIVEVPDKGLAQIEFADGASLSLGPGSQFYAASLVGRGAKGGGMSEFYLVRGWTKLAVSKSTAPFRVTTPLFGLGTAEAIAVAQVGPGEASLFVESGELRLAEGYVKATPTNSIRLRGGQFYARKADQKGVAQPRPAPAFIAAMPKSYLDNLPVRLAKYKERDVPPRRIADLDYADVEVWLKSPLEIRRPIMQKFIEKANEPEFRRAVIANMRFHPEWDRIIFPEKYQPKPPPPPEPEPLPPIVWPPPATPPPRVAAPIPAPPSVPREPKPAQPSSVWPPVEGAGTVQTPRNQ